MANSSEIRTKRLLIVPFGEKHLHGSYVGWLNYAGSFSLFPTKLLTAFIDKDIFGLSRDRLCEALLAENIITRKYFYPPVHLQEAF